MSFTIFNQTILYAQYLSNEAEQLFIGVDELKDSFEELYPFMSENDDYKENIEKIIKALKIEKKDKVDNRYRTIAELCEHLKGHPKKRFSFELLKILRKLDLDLNNLDPEISAMLEEQNVFSFENARFIKENLSTTVFGQDKAIDIVSDAFKDDLLVENNKPRNVFFFLGPSGAGKTFMANEISTLFYDHALKIINMSQYSYPDSEGNLFGNNRMWGNSKVGELTSHVRQNPKSIIVFDEFDKAHTNTQNALLTVLNDGYIDDACGWCKDGKPFYKDRVSEDDCSEENSIYRVNFNETILIFTTNLGSQLYNDHRFMENFDDNYTYSQQLLYDVLSKETKNQRTQNNSSRGSNSSEQLAILPHFLSRLMQGKLILFSRLSLNNLIQLITKLYKEFEEKLHYRHDIKLECDDENKKYLFPMLILQLAPNIDARNVNAKSIQLFYNDILEHIEKLKNGFDNLESISLKVSASAKKYYDKHFTKMVEGDELIKYFFRKNLAFKMETKARTTKQTLHYTIDTIQHHKINSVADFQGEEALVFEVPDIMFDDIAGHDSTKKRLKEVVHYLKDPQTLEKYQIDIPKGLLMYGKPGTGKTMLAKAFANEADLPIIQTTGTKLLNQIHMKNIYKKAKEYAPSIIFIDEIDAIGKRDGYSAKDMVINQFLSELNGFNDDKEQMVFTIAATNFKNKIDKAILRSGRIDLHIEIDSLDKKGREFFIDKLLEKPNDGKIDKQKVLFYTAGMTGADLEKALRESSLEALRQKNKEITQDIFIEQINIIKYGQRNPEKSIDSILSETAYHEAGHAVISNLLMPHIKIEQITITPREDTLGFVSYNNEHNDSNPSKEELENKIAIAFAGRIAQMQEFGEEGFDVGASSDLQKATKYAYLMVAHFGMDETLGYLNIDGIPNLQYEKNNISDTNFLQEDIQKSVKKIIKEIEIRTKDLVEQNWTKIDKLAKVLIKNEVVEYDEIEGVLINGE